MKDSLYKNSEPSNSAENTAHDNNDHKSLTLTDNLGDILDVIFDNNQKPKIEKLQERLLDELARYTGLNKEQIIIYSEPDASLKAIIDCFLDEDQEVVAMMPAETTLIYLVERKGLIVRECYGDNPFMIDPVSVPSAVYEKCGLMYFANPTRPAGAVFSQHELEMLLENAGDFVSILDENEYELCGIDYSRLIEKYPKLIILRRFPHLLGLASTPGEYLLGSVDVMNRIRGNLRTGFDSGLSGTASMAALRSLGISQKDQRMMRENMILCEIKLRGLGYRCQKTPFDYILVEVTDSAAATAWLMARGVLCRSLGHFRQLEDYIALNIGSDENVIRAIDCFGRMPKSYRRSSGGN